MNHTLYMRMFLAAALALAVSACGQKGPLVAPPETPAPQDAPAPAAAAAPAMTEEADD